METTENRYVTKAAHIISDVFSPIMMPTYAMAVALWLTIMVYLPLPARLKALFGVFAITAVIPFLFIVIMIRLGKINDASISDRSQRPAPYSVAIVCYVGAALMLISMRAPLWLTTFYFGAAVVSLLSLIITRWWKISAHAGAVGGVAGGMYWLACHGLLMNPVLWLCIVIALTGLLCWSRLYLGRHTVLQVIAGAVMAFLVEYGMLCLI